MDQTKQPGPSNAGSFKGSSGEHGASIADAANHGKDALAADAANAKKAGEADLSALKDDLNKLRETIAELISNATRDATKSAREMTTNVADQVSGVAADFAEKGSQVASTATGQARTFAAEIESLARRNPFGAIAGAVFVGILIGMLGRRS
jgi:ElaB/YqjD/DUF883 family membrane-anchored ribosome-binding protein